MLKKFFAVIMAVLFVIMPASGCTSSSSNTDNYDEAETDTDTYDDDYNAYDDTDHSDYNYDDTYSDSDTDSNASDGYRYNKDDPYYSKNDHNGDGKINDEEFQDALGDALDDIANGSYN